MSSSIGSVLPFPNQLRTAVSWRTLRRVHKDRRARAQLLWLLLLLGLIAYEVWFAYYSIHENGGPSLIGYAVGVVVFAGVFVYRRYKPVQESGPLKLDLAVKPDLAPVPDVHAGPELLCEVGERALVNSMLALRAASEGFLKHRGVPEGGEIVTRRNHIRLLREYALYDRLGSTERDLLVLPDGAWAEEAIGSASLLLESVRVYRWLLGIDATLPLVGEALLIDFRHATAVLENPAALFAATDLRPMDELRIARSGAEEMFYRCYTEGQRRGFYIDADAAQAEQAIFYAQRLAGDENRDALIGNVIVSHALDDEVRLAAAASLKRLEILRWTQQRLYQELERSAELTAL